MDVLKAKIIEMHKLISEQNDLYVDIWKGGIFLAWRWWIAVALLIWPWVVWYLARKKDSTDRLLYSGLFVYLITSILDSIGVAFGLWCYIVTPVPFIHTYYLPWDLTVFPVVVMLLIQFKPKVSPYIKALIFAGTSSLVAEPVFAWLDIYQPLHWEYIYGLPFYFVIYLIANAVSKRNNFAYI